MIRTLIICILFFYLGECSNLFAQTRITLEEAIEISLSNSNNENVKISKNISELDYSLFKKTYLPTISLSSVFPSFSRSVRRVTTPEGDDIFVNQNQAFYDLRLQLEQQEPLFGGKITVSSYLNRIDLFGQVDRQSYFSTPFSIDYEITNFVFNIGKYERIINELNYKEQHINTVVAYEDIINQVVKQYCDAYISNVTVKTLEKSLENAKKVFSIAQKRFEIGSINKGDLIALELNTIEIEESLEQSKVDLISIERSLKSSLGIDTVQNLLFELNSEQILELNLNYDKVLPFFVKNTPKTIQKEKNIAEKELEIKRFKHSNKFSINLNASYGLSNTANTFDQSIIDLQDQQAYSLRLNYNLFDFGKNKQKLSLLKQEKELIESDYNLEIRNLKDNLNNHIIIFNRAQQKEISLARKKDLIKQRYDFIIARFRLGKTNITDLNNAQKQLQQLNLDYLRNLKDVWTRYYEIRRIVLFDFLNNKSLL